MADPVSPPPVDDPRDMAINIALDALRRIAWDRCSKLTTGPGSCWRNYERPGWCDECVALDALRRIEAGTGEPAQPSWQQMLTAERDDALAELNRVRSVFQHVGSAWDQMQSAARQVVRADLPTEGVDRA